jgi:hypothetical protein
MRIDQFQGAVNTIQAGLIAGSANIVNQEMGGIRVKHTVTQDYGDQ